MKHRAGNVSKFILNWTQTINSLEGIQLELGILSLGTTIKARRINFLHYLLSTGDWTEQVKIDLADFHILPNLNEIKKKSKNCFKKMVKIKAKEYELSTLLKRKQTHTKMSNLSYSKLEMQEYLKLVNVNASMAKTLFRYRVRMADYGENFRAGSQMSTCPLCGLHLDSQSMAYENCPVVKSKVDTVGSYTDIFGKYISVKVVKTLQNIDQLREKHKEI